MNGGFYTQSFYFVLLILFLAFTALLIFFMSKWLIKLIDIQLDKLDKKVKEVGNKKTFLIIITFVICGWLIIVLSFSVFNVFGLKLSHFGEWGDSFGFLTALFTGISVYFILSSIQQHEKEMTETRKEMKNTRQVMEKANELKSVENENFLSNVQLERLKLCKLFNLNINIVSANFKDLFFMRVSISPTEDYEKSGIFTIYSHENGHMCFSRSFQFEGDGKDKIYHYRLPIQKPKTHYFFYISKQVFNLHQTKSFISTASTNGKYDLSLFNEMVDTNRPLMPTIKANDFAIITKI